MQHRKISRKAQEEMVGFVMIMLLVAVIFLVFLGIFLRSNKNVERDQNAEVAQFLDAALEYTTTCSLDNYRYLEVSELISACASADQCDNGQPACAVLKQTLKNLVDASWNFGPESPNKGYTLDIIRETSEGERRVEGLFQASGCSSKTGAEKPLHENIKIVLDVCLN